VEEKEKREIDKKIGDLKTKAERLERENKYSEVFDIWTEIGYLGAVIGEF